MESLCRGTDSHDCDAAHNPFDGFPTELLRRFSAWLAVQGDTTIRVIQVTRFRTGELSPVQLVQEDARRLSLPAGKALRVATRYPFMSRYTHPSPRELGLMTALFDETLSDADAGAVRMSRDSGSSYVPYTN